ncbi:LD-carboxypeptidase [Clostridium sp. W14A]|uniref:LD-carboxypeptidase n=1 Tax=Caproicibacter fermentans TaxID=2576756 RepID=A0A7G8TAG4_9FIRM|nr:LD-carboxypeptidase [Caproicibacter fermentans]OCN03059.1 LD-carboxypeptidase [Clostridium sp. W14A]QNK40605.1 LD-carboxypeptidase [Caproicibacter fermentans]
MINPKPLFPGARVALIAPSGPVPPERLEPAVRSVEKLGLVPVVYESCRSAHGYLAGEDQLRADDLNHAFADRSIDGILCIRGGYGAQRILKKLDFSCIRKHPKFFSGYSDVTTLHIALNQLCGFITYHTPMPSTELYDGADEYTMKSLKRVMFGDSAGTLENPGSMEPEVLVPGCACGRLTGGNLSLVASSLGTPFEIDTRGKILFLEDVDEEPYRIDRMLTQLLLAGKLNDCAGLMFGYWTRIEAEQPERSLTLLQIFRELIVPQGRPALMNLACGHSLPSMSLPMGKKLKMDASAKKISILR